MILGRVVGNVVATQKNYHLSEKTYDCPTG